MRQRDSTDVGSAGSARAVDPQTEKWAGDFGRAYTDRNIRSEKEWESLYVQNYGMSKTEMNRLFLDHMDRTMPILEVGSNVGDQLACLQRMDFTQLHGVELQSYAAELSTRYHPDIPVMVGSAFDLPYGSGSFDLVFTAGLLNGIHPDNLGQVMSEMHRCTRRFIWCMEYYSPTLVEIEYRGNRNFLWKADYAKIFLERFKDLRLVKEQHFKNVGSTNLDTMFLLEKAAEAPGGESQGRLIEPASI